MFKEVMCARNFIVSELLEKPKSFYRVLTIYVVTLRTWVKWKRKRGREQEAIEKSGNKR
jgi:hypothetical protein